MKIRKNALTAVIALLVITIIAAGFRFGMGMAVHSDDVCLLFTGKDWVNGNFFLKDWWFSTGTFGLPMLEQCTSQQKVDTTLYFYTSFNEHNTPYTVLESDNSESMPDVLH